MLQNFAGRLRRYETEYSMLFTVVGENERKREKQTDRDRQTKHFWPWLRHFGDI